MLTKSRASSKKHIAYKQALKELVHGHKKSAIHIPINTGTNLVNQRPRIIRGTTGKRIGPMSFGRFTAK